MKLNVFLHAYGRRCQVGLLYEENSRIFFEYAPDFLASGIELSPFKLPLRPGVFEDGKYTFDGLYGLFNDSLPASTLTIAGRESSFVANELGILQYSAQCG